MEVDVALSNQKNNCRQPAALKFKVLFMLAHKTSYEQFSLFSYDDKPHRDVLLCVVPHTNMNSELVGVNNVDHMEYPENNNHDKPTTEEHELSNSVDLSIWPLHSVTDKAFYSTIASISPNALVTYCFRGGTGGRRFLKAILRVPVNDVQAIVHLCDECDKYCAQLTEKRFEPKYKRPILDFADIVQHAFKSVKELKIQRKLEKARNRLVEKQVSFDRVNPQVHAEVVENSQPRVLSFSNFSW